MTLKEFEIKYKRKPVAGIAGVHKRVIYPQSSLKEEMGFYNLDDYIVMSVIGHSILLVKKDSERDRDDSETYTQTQEA